jgi:hypothetical protein
MFILWLQVQTKTGKDNNENNSVTVVTLLGYGSLATSMKCTSVFKNKIKYKIINTQ